MRTLLVACSLMAAVSASAQPTLNHAQVTEQALTGSLDATVRGLVAQASEPSWIAWGAPSIARHRSGDRWCWSDGTIVQSNRLEGPETVFVFLRIEGRRIERVRTFEDGCPIDAGGRRVTWLRGVKPAESVALLANLAGSTSGEHAVWKGALAALAQHAGTEPVRPLVRLAREGDTRVRSEALFWLSQRAGREAEAAITDAIENDPETTVKKRAVFALSQLPPAEGVPRLIEVARSHRNPAVRKQAMFWLGQSKDPRAIAFFEEVLR